MKSRIVGAKVTKKKALYTRKFDLNIRKNCKMLHWEDKVLHGNETWTLRKVNQNTGKF
jgi:hypothetical protein